MVHGTPSHNQLDSCRSPGGDAHLFRTPGQQVHSSASPHLSLARSPLPARERESIIGQLSFLNQYRNSIHSIVVVGSTAYSTQTENSDVDIVIITTPGGHEKICNIVFEKEIEAALSSAESRSFEYTVLSSEQLQKLFQIASPFAYSIRYGAIIQDDGYLLLLRNRRFPVLPTKEYYASSLYEYIATPYYGTLKKLQQNIKEKGCTESCSRKSSGCEGLQPVYVFANLIMRMFYVTLPSRGMIPLTKADVVSYAKTAYGSQGEKVAEQVIQLMRSRRPTLCFVESRILKKFAVNLFREILGIIGFETDVRNIIKDAVRVARGDYQLISNRSLRNCVL